MNYQGKTHGTKKLNRPLVSVGMINMKNLKTLGVLAGLAALAQPLSTNANTTETHQIQVTQNQAEPQKQGATNLIKRANHEAYVHTHSESGLTPKEYGQMLQRIGKQKWSKKMYIRR